jgi:hypothetical protein
MAAVRGIHGIPFDLHFGLRTTADNPIISPSWTLHARRLLNAELFNEAGPRRPTIQIWSHANLTFTALDSLATQLFQHPGPQEYRLDRQRFASSPRDRRAIRQTASLDSDEFPLLFRAIQFDRGSSLRLASILAQPVIFEHIERRHTG